MSNTPRTDAAESQCRTLESLYDAQPLSRLCRTLERELAEAHQEIKRLRASWNVAAKVADETK